MDQNICAFQYAYTTNGIFKDTKIVCDKDKLTLIEAKGLWNQYFPDCAKRIRDEYSCEMVIWVAMGEQTYGESLCYISSDAESDGTNIWLTKKEYFTKEFKLTKE